MDPKGLTMCDRVSDNLDYSGVEQAGPGAYYDSGLRGGDPSDHYMEDEVYDHVVKDTIVACVDVLLYRIREGVLEVFLPRRKSKPQPGRWVLGGRRFVFKTFAEGALYNLQRETKLDCFDVNTFEEVPGTFDMAWAQSAQGCPTHTWSKLMAYQVPVGMDEIQLNGEYSSSDENNWFSLEEALAASNIHPTLRAMLEAFRDRNSDMKHVHSDARRTIYEAIHKVHGGKITRTTVITVHQDGARLGDHFHSRRESFVVEAGSGVLLRGDQGGGNVDVTRFVEGDTFTVNPGETHTFICQKGTVLVAVTGWLFEEAVTTACKLQLAA
jgi:mannose-6-phosphate isomerase-like protein (cupin superfamily)